MNKDLKLEDVLEGYAADTPGGNDPAVLKKWMAMHPGFAEDLLAFAAERSRIRHIPAPDLSDVEIRAAMSRGRAALERFREAAKKKPANISSLTALAEERGMDKTAFAKAVGLSVSLLIYLENRRVRAASVPAKVVGGIAAALGATAEAVSAYLELPPTAAALNYKAEDRPVDTGQRDFALAVEQDQMLTREEKDALLSETE